jgi:uncharacterized protein (TIGR02145 family)
MRFKKFKKFYQTVNSQKYKPLNLIAMSKKSNLLAFFVILLMFASSCTKEDPSDIIIDGNTVADIDGNVYHTVKIGTQTWMVENLKTTKYNDGISIPVVSDGTAWAALTTPGYCFYGNDATNKTTYGALYNWYAVNTGKLAPTGWHVPTDAEWTILENYLIANGYNYDSTTTGNKIAKSLASTSGWSSSSNAGAIGNDLTKNNTSGFAGLPGGFRDGSGGFGDIGFFGHWWSSIEDNTSFPWSRYLNYYGYCVYRYGTNKPCGFSVRCLRDY